MANKRFRIVWSKGGIMQKDKIASSAGEAYIQLVRALYYAPWKGTAVRAQLLNPENEVVCDEVLDFEGQGARTSSSDVASDFK